MRLGKRAADVYSLSLPTDKGREVPQGPRIAFRATPRSPIVSPRLSILHTRDTQHLPEGAQTQAIRDGAGSSSSVLSVMWAWQEGAVRGPLLPTLHLDLPLLGMGWNKSRHWPDLLHGLIYLQGGAPLTFLRPLDVSTSPLPYCVPLTFLCPLDVSTSARCFCVPLTCVPLTFLSP